MLKKVIIFWTHGTLVYAHSYDEEDKDPTVVSSFLSAFSSFAKELGEGEIRSINMHKHMILMEIQQDLVFTAWFDQDDEETQGKLILENIIKEFIIEWGNKLDKRIPIDLSRHRGFTEKLDNLRTIKNVYEIIESINQVLSLHKIQEIYQEKFNSSLSLTKGQECLNFLIKSDAIREMKEGHEIRYRKKGELLKSLSLKLKKE